MGILKDLTVLGASRFIGNAYFTNITANQFIKSGGTSSQFLKADGSVDSTTYLKTSDISSWAKASTKPSYTLDEVTDGSTRKLSDYVTLTTAQTISGVKTFSNGFTITAQSSANNDKNIVFSAGARIGSNTSGDIGIYSAASKKVYIRPSTSSTTVGLIIDSSTITYNENTVWHAGNDGASSGLDADLLDGQHGSYYLNYDNFTNKPTIPATNVIPAITTANKVLLSTTTSGTAAWSTWSTAGFLKTNTSGVVSIDSTAYAPLASPTFTGTPAAPTATAGTNTTQIATTAFVQTAVNNKVHYVANLQAGTAANYITEPEVKTVKINGSTTNSASTTNCVLQFDTTNQCLKFVFN